MPVNSIYRFMSFESFVDMIQRNALTFVYHELWEDPYEGFLFKAIKDARGKEQILTILKKLTPEYVMLNFGVLLKFGRTIYGQSWTKCPESDALWRIYSNGQKSIRIEVSIKDISRLEGVKSHDIKYSKSFSLESQLKKIFKKNKTYLHNILLTKRTAFKHEQEVRLLTDIDLDYLPNDQTTFPPEALKVFLESGEITKEQFETGINSINRKKILPDEKYIFFDHIDNFINSVMLHPLAPKWFDETLIRFCEDKGLKFLGKSKLYQFYLD